MRRKAGKKKAREAKEIAYPLSFYCFPLTLPFLHSSLFLCAHFSQRRFLIYETSFHLTRTILLREILTCGENTMWVVFLLKKTILPYSEPRWEGRCSCNSDPTDLLTLRPAHPKMLSLCCLFELKMERRFILFFLMKVKEKVSRFRHFLCKFLLEFGLQRMLTTSLHFSYYFQP